VTAFERVPGNAICTPAELAEREAAEQRAITEHVEQDRERVVTETTTTEAEAPEAPQLPEGGRWLELELLGHRVRAGYVTEVTVAGAALLHIDLPAKLFGGDPDAWEEYAPSALYCLSPESEESVRKAWETKRREAEERERQRAYWQKQEQRALTAGDIRDSEDDLDVNCACEIGYTCESCREAGVH
jgi:hypothetical protein